MLVQGLVVVDDLAARPRAPLNASGILTLAGAARRLSTATPTRPLDGDSVGGTHNVYCVTVARAPADKMSNRCGKRPPWHERCLSNSNGNCREGSKATGLPKKKAQIRNAVWMTRRILCLDRTIITRRDSPHTSKRPTPRKRGFFWLGAPDFRKNHTRQPAGCPVRSVS